MLRVRIDEIGYKLQNNQVDLEYFVERGPTPDPIYDTNGNRVNTRDFRAKVKLMNERHILIEKALEINPGMQPPTDFQGMANTKTKKIYIPNKEFPDYNFIGLIIGPRGITQKEMENETGAKIAIRGKGSAKDGKVGNYGEGDNDELHVLITGDTDQAIRRASRKIKRLLTPIDEGQNEHKRKQLKKLAEINGTLRDNVFEPLSRNWSSADVYCKHCGEISHPSQDCPMKNMPIDKNLVDSEFDSFMQEIGLPSHTYTGDEEKDMNKFMEEIQNVGQYPYYGQSGYAPPPNPYY